MNRETLEGLELFAAMAEHLAEDSHELASKVISDSKDPKRSFKGRLRQAIFARDHGVCFYCGVDLIGQRWHADHVIPHTLGGRTIEENGVVACPPCNLSKSAKVW